MAYGMAYANNNRTARENDATTTNEQGDGATSDQLLSS